MLTYKLKLIFIRIYCVISALHSEWRAATGVMLGEEDVWCLPRARTRIAGVYGLPFCHNPNNKCSYHVTDVQFTDV